MNIVKDCGVEGRKTWLSCNTDAFVNLATCKEVCMTRWELFLRRYPAIDMFFFLG